MGFLRSYGPLIVLLSTGTAFSFWWLLHFAMGMHLQKRAIAIISVLHTVIGLFSVLLFGYLETGNPGSMSLYGGVFIMPLYYLLLVKATKNKSAVVFDIMTFCLVGTLFCARINCIISGCCYGISFFGSQTLRWPTREMELLFYFAIAVTVGRKVWKNPGKVHAYPLYMMCYGAFRFITEFLRFSSTHTVFHRGHLWSAIAFCLGASIYFTLRSREAFANKNTHRKREMKNG